MDFYFCPLGTNGWENWVREREPEREREREETERGRSSLGRKKSAGLLILRLPNKKEEEMKMNINGRGWNLNQRTQNYLCTIRLATIWRQCTPPDYPLSFVAAPADYPPSFVPAPPPMFYSSSPTRLSQQFCFSPSRLSPRFCSYPCRLSQIMVTTIGTNVFSKLYLIIWNQHAKFDTSPLLDANYHLINVFMLFGKTLTKTFKF